MLKIFNKSGKIYKIDTKTIIVLEDLGFGACRCLHQRGLGAPLVIENFTTDFLRKEYYGETFKIIWKCNV